jgi:peptidoglycan/LPS O-acetylase OafA/YrhL
MTEPTTTPAPEFGMGTVTRRPQPLFGTIFWGVLLLAFAAFMVVWTIVPEMPDPTLWLLGGVIAVGLLLVVAGIAAASRRAG